MADFTCLGYRVSFDMADGGHLRAPAGAAALYDETGKKWPRSSILITSFRKSTREIKSQGLEKKWFGASYDTREGTVVLPPRALGEWKNVGHPTRIFFTRDGELEGNYEHPFGDVKGGMMRWLLGGAVWSFGGEKKLPVLYTRGSAMRLELGSSARITRAGIVSP
jgi:hypothetical protein